MKTFLIFLFLLLTSPINVQAKETTVKLKDYPIIIACENIYTGEFKTPKNESVEDNGCALWKGYKNILLPSKAQMKLLKEVYTSKDEIITAMVLINHESQFNKNAKGCHKNGCDYGLLQIRDVNGWKNMTQKEQMEWFKKRKASQLKKGGNCYKRMNESQENGVRCVFARHHWDLSGKNKYPTARYNEWKYYQKYFEWKKF